MDMRKITWRNSYLSHTFLWMGLLIVLGGLYTQVHETSYVGLILMAIGTWGEIESRKIRVDLLKFCQENCINFVDR